MRRVVVVATLFLASALAQPQGEMGVLTTTDGQMFPGQLLEPVIALEMPLAVGGLLRVGARFIRRIENTDSLDALVLRDDIRLTGTIANAVLQFATALGTSAVDLGLIRTVELSGGVPIELALPPDTHRQVRLTDGQVLAGRISSASGDVAIQLSYGTLCLQAPALRALRVTDGSLAIEATDGARFSGPGTAPDLILVAPYGAFLIPGQLIQVLDVPPR